MEMKKKTTKNKNKKIMMRMMRRKNSLRRECVIGYIGDTYRDPDEEKTIKTKQKEGVGGGGGQGRTTPMSAPHKKKTK